MIEIGKAKEGLYILHFCRCGPTCNSIWFDRIHGKLTRFDDYSKVFHLGGSEATFLKFEVKIQFSHSLEATFSVFSVNLFIWEENEKVIHIDHEPSFGNHVMKGAIHKSLECCWGVDKAKEHDSWFKKAFMGDKDGFPLVAIFDADVVIPLLDIKFSKEFGVFELVDEVGDKGKGIGIANSVFIQVMIVLAGVESSILLFDKEERRCLKGV